MECAGTSFSTKSQLKINKLVGFGLEQLLLEVFARKPQPVR